MRGALRVSDNGPLWHAAREGSDVIPFLCSSDVRGDRGETPRRIFLLGAIADLDAGLRRRGSALFLLDGDPLRAIPRAAVAVGARALYVAEDHDPAVREADRDLARALAGIGCSFTTLDDAVLFGKDAVLTAAGTPYTVFTPYRRALMARIREAPPPYPVCVRPIVRWPRLGEFSGRASAGPTGGETAALRRVRVFMQSGIGPYARRRDTPSEDGTSRLSHHIARGTLSVRTLLARASEAGGAEVFIAELVWREFFHQILRHFPSVAVAPFREEFSSLDWSRSRRRFEAWRNGETGYPVVDAGMRQLRAEGWMHNRVRMITASFLTKDLHIDWRWGERHFAALLTDADTASNNGNWQWTAGTGTDAAPYFRIFNPVLQGKRFDPGGAYVRRYVPELSRLPEAWIHEPWAMGAALAREMSFRIGRDYPRPIVDHRAERAVALGLYRAARREKHT